MLEVEVMGPYMQFYKVFLCNILEDVAEISVKDDSKSTISIPLSFLYKTIIADCPSQIKIGDDIEVYIQLNTAIPIEPDNCQITKTDQDIFSKLAVARNQLAWWPAKVQNIRGDYLVVQVAGLASCTDVVDKTTVRPLIPCIDNIVSPRNGEHRQPLDSKSFLKRVLHIPRELSQCCKDVSAYKSLLRYCKTPPTLYYDEQKSQLNIFAFDVDVIRQVEVLEDTYLKMLKQKWNLMQSMNQATKRLESTRLANNKSANFVESFYIPKICMGLAIGSKGVNIQQARQIDDVVAIDVCDETCSFVIYAKTKEAIVAARKIIEYSETVVPVPQRLVARIIGKSGSNIQTMVDKSGVIRVRIENNQWPPNDPAIKRQTKSTEDRNGGYGRDISENLSRKAVETETKEPVGTDNDPSSVGNTDFVNFVFIGTIESINNAKLLISFQVETLQELDMIQAEKAEIIRELHTVESQNSLPFLAPSYPPPHRNGPPYNLPVGNHRQMHQIKFAPREEPFFDRHHNYSPRYPGRYPNAKSTNIYEPDYSSNTANDEYSLAPGGPPSGSQQRGRYPQRYGREGDGPPDSGSRGRSGRDGYQGRPDKPDVRRQEPRRRGDARATEGDRAPACAS